MFDTPETKMLRENLRGEDRVSDYLMGVSVTTLRLLLERSDQLELESQRAEGLQMALESEQSLSDCRFRETVELHAELDAIRVDQDPVAWTDAEELRSIENGSFGYIFKIDPTNPYIDPRRQIPIYRQPKAFRVPEGQVLVPIEPTDEQLRLMLAQRYPALFREHLRHPLNGSRLQEDTENLIDMTRRQYKAAIKQEG